MVTPSLGELSGPAIEQLPEAVAADAGYWNEQHMDEVVANKHIPVLVAPDKGSRGTPRKGWTGGRYDWMRAVLDSEHGGQRYQKRRQTIEPLFGDTKHNKGVTRFHRRGRIKVRTEWRLHDDDPQPHQAPPPPDSHRKGLKGAHGGDTLPHHGPATTDPSHQTPARRYRSRRARDDSSGLRDSLRPKRECRGRRLRHARRLLCRPTDSLVQAS